MSRLYLNVFGFCIIMSFVMGASFSTYRNYIPESNVDCLDYINLAKHNFKEANPVRRYRQIVPEVARSLDVVISPLFYKIWNDKDPNQDWSLKFSFFVVNIFLMALTAFVIWHTFVKLFGRQLDAAMGVLPFLSSIWLPYLAGTPMVDSLYHLQLVMLFCGLILKKDYLVVISILIGPWAKESFVFFVPIVIWWFWNEKVSKWIALIIVTYVIVIFYRVSLDSYLNVSTAQSVNSDLSHLNNIVYSLKRIVCVKGILEMFSVFGLFFIPVCFEVFWVKKPFNKISMLLLGFFLVILIHVLLSGETSRMFYFFAGPFCYLFCKSISSLKITIS